MRALLVAQRQRPREQGRSDLWVGCQNAVFERRDVAAGDSAAAEITRQDALNSAMFVDRKQEPRRHPKRLAQHREPAGVVHAPRLGTPIDKILPRGQVAWFGQSHLRHGLRCSVAEVPTRSQSPTLPGAGRAR